MNNRNIFVSLLLLGCSSILGSAFTTPRHQLRPTPRLQQTSLFESKLEISTENWTFNPFDVNDLSPLDTLLRRGVVPLGIRLGRPQKYEQAVLDYMTKEGCDRATAQRNMDAFFNDPNGWVVSYGRKRDLGEDFGDINAPTGVQKRPVFSLLWGSFCFWLFFVFFPTRIQELGGIEPSFGTSGGACLYQKRDSKGALYCENGPKAFEKSAMDYLDKQQQEQPL